jgi:autophagy-related protein 27
VSAEETEQGESSHLSTRRASTRVLRNPMRATGVSTGGDGRALILTVTAVLRRYPRQPSLTPMPHRHRLPSPVVILSLLLVSWLSFVSAQDGCHIEVDGFMFDFSAIAGEHAVSRTRETPPTSMQDSIRFSLCSELQLQDGIGQADQVRTVLSACTACVPHARGALRYSVYPARMRASQKRTKSRTRRIVLSQLYRWRRLRGSSRSMRSHHVRRTFFSSLFLISRLRYVAPKGVTVTLHGPSYPSSSSADPLPQSFRLELLCATEASEYKFKSYDGAQVDVEWSTPAGCGFKKGDDGESPKDDETEGGGESGGGGDDKTEESMGSGLGWFFLV